MELGRGGKMWGKHGKKQLKFYEVLAKGTLLYGCKAWARRKKNAGGKRRK
jgi:hypothetical protein